MRDASRSPLDAPTPHHLLDGFLAARAEIMPADLVERDREVIESFRAYMEHRDEAEGRVQGPDVLARRRVVRADITPNDLLAAERIMLEIRRFLNAHHEQPAPSDSSSRLVLRLLSRWLFNRGLVTESVSRLIDEFTFPYAVPDPSRRRAGYSASKRSRRRW